MDTKYWEVPLRIHTFQSAKRSFFQAAPFHVLHGFHRENVFIIPRIAILLYGASQAAINAK